MIDQIVEMMQRVENEMEGQLEPMVLVMGIGAHDALRAECSSPEESPPCEVLELHTPFMGVPVHVYDLLQGFAYLPKRVWDEFQWRPQFEFPVLGPQPVRFCMHDPGHKISRVE